MKCKRLGKGLDALFFNENEVHEDDHVQEIRLAEIQPNPYQPRRTFEKEALNELASSIEQHGVLQPIIVRRKLTKFEIIVGERRFRAAKLAKKSTIPAVIREMNDKQMMEVALVENLQREDLNPIEKAMAYDQMLTHLAINQETLAKKLGISRPEVTNYLRLLTLPSEVKIAVEKQTLSYAHARILAGLKDSDLVMMLAEKVVREKLSIIELERVIKKLEMDGKSLKKRQLVRVDPSVLHRTKGYEETLREFFGTKVEIKHGLKKGRIEIEYYSLEDLERLIELL
ncbi:MAG: hypothetical protein RLZ12_195 [Bacillota bacterium]|jgi:ParB family chromosome partitioning protein